MTTSSSTSRLKLFSAFAEADLTTLAIGTVAFCGKNRRMFSASDTGLPLIVSNTSRTFWGDILMCLATARTSTPAILIPPVVSRQ